LIDIINQRCRFIKKYKSVGIEININPVCLEVLHIEVRLNKRNKIRQLFNKPGIKATLTFKKLFKPVISKKVLLHYMNEIESKRPFILDYQSAADKAFFSTLIINKLSPKRIVELYGLKKALEVVTLRELRTMLNVGKRSSANWSKLLSL